MNDASKKPVLALGDRLWLGLRPVLQAYPDINFEFVIDYGLADIVANRFDGGVRLGGMIDRDMIAVPIGPQGRMAVVAALAYFADPAAPEAPAAARSGAST